MSRRIGILGSGAVGQTLAKGFARHGYEVMLGTNTPSKLEELARKTEGKATIGSFEATAKFGETLVLAVKGTGAEEAMKLAGLENFRGKTVIDTMNPIADAPPTNGVLHYFTTLEESLMERLQRLALQANFVKAFSIIGSAYMVNPDFDSKPTMFICGNSPEAKAEVTQILELFGWETEDVGLVESARAIEPLCILWCAPGFIRNQWAHAFKLIKK